MENNKNIFESLIESTTDYGHLSYDLMKLKTLDKASDITSTFITYAVILIIIAASLLFINLGLALWLGEILGKIYLGFFAVAIINGLFGIIFHQFLYKQMRKLICDYIIKEILK